MNQQPGLHAMHLNKNPYICIQAHDYILSLLGSSNKIKQQTKNINNINNITNGPKALSLIT